MFAAKYPGAMLLCEWPCSSNGAQRDLLPGALHFQGVTGLKMQLFTQRLGYDDAACSINNETAIHSGTTPRVKPSVNTILAYSPGAAPGSLAPIVGSERESPR